MPLLRLLRKAHEGFFPEDRSNFLKAGIGYGGSCFPKDTKALKFIARQHGFQLIDLMLDSLRAETTSGEIRLEQVKAACLEICLDKCP